jgi:hypothetical protein
MNIFQSAGFQLNGGNEQNYDAIYLAIHNLVPPALLPYQLADLEWTLSQWYTGSSSSAVPPIEQWSISWRDDAKHVIILFSDEEGQSYLKPKITESVLVDMINVADELAVYAFTSPSISSGIWGDTYEPLTKAGMSGKIYELTMKSVVMYNSLLEILDETACGGKKPASP